MSVNPSGDFTNWFHGSRSTYNAGCHCDACTDAANRYSRERTEAARPVVLARPEPWMAEAACAGHNTHDFFPIINEDALGVYAAARLVCASCPVSGHCLDYALEHNEKHGMWGGLTPTQRRHAAAAARRRRTDGAA